MSEDMATELDLDALRSSKLRAGIKFQKLAFMTYAGVMPKLTFEVPFVEIAERFTFDRLLNRNDFDVDDDAQHGNRDITEAHVKKIADGIRSTDRPYLGTLTVALGKKDVKIEEVQKISEFVSLVYVTVYEDAPNPVVEDGQHRIKMATMVWPMVKNADEGDAGKVRDYLRRTSVEMTMLLEHDADVLSTIFVRMGSTKPISPNLIAVMDKSTCQNRLGLYVARQSRLLSSRVSYLSTTASRAMAAKKGRKFDDLYPAAAVRSAAASMAGVGVRDRTPEQRESILSAIVAKRAKTAGVAEEAAIALVGRDVVAILDYAYDTIPGWKDIANGKITVPEFKKRFVHSSAAGLHVIANTVAAGVLQGLNAHAVVDGLAKLPWSRDALRDGTNEAGEEIKVHEFFEGTLATTVYDVKLGTWRAGAGGATRSNYEPAIDKVLRQLSRDPALRPLGERSAQVAIGLISDKAGPGRPRKVVA